MREEWTAWHARLGNLCRSLRDTDFHEWGFVICRGVYGDDDAWISFVQCFRDNVHLDLARGIRRHGSVERGAMLEQYAQWTVIEDSATLDGASRDDIRQRFLTWREGRIVRRPVAANPFPIPGDAEPITVLPRFTYCLYVDYDCLATLGPHLAGKPSDISQPHLPPPLLVVILIDGDYVTQQDAQGPFPPIDGSTVRYVGWEYFDTRHICALYNDLHISTLDVDDYHRPPAISPGGSRSMPVV
ncbi:hypothetical protein F5144DRAFT_493459 [Chaetomium tenue]|uniref:Uncharacterized protein n=2 Tax=Chaetomium tenue TaxID=1854479 RepID=A0ACB7NU76_9PEZI|nr:hypothetical protein F5144DRAFT_500081 [Chaetomium globosum]KAH6628087.1 hypothetical protein F5144DRAFT_493459 [Chaetomium globosum]